MKKVILGLAFLVLLLGMYTVANAEELDNPVHHVVLKGDTLWHIAGAYHVSLSDLISMNEQIENPDLIYPNDKVYLPQPTFNDKYYKHN